TLAPTTKGPRLASRPVDDARPRPMGVSPRLNVWGNGPARRNPDPRRLRRSRDLELLAKLSNHALPVTSEQILNGAFWNGRSGHENAVLQRTCRGRRISADHPILDMPHVCERVVWKIC